MFIKDIIISGFRSYREQSFPDGLSRKSNTIVGKNGSGKSNFFAAVQFVLNEKFSNLRPADRKELFHVGSGRPALSIFVEIVFDNSDGRLVIPGRAEEREVRIRRTVGLKQDEFRVNDRKFTASEVHQLLESAGFSSSNPYYVVEQGKIVDLVSMSERERYLLIKDVAGTKVYEARRQESEKILEEMKVKHSQIEESIAQLREKIGDLEGETVELKQLQELDQEKKCIEYCIFNSELEVVKGSMRKLEEEWSSNVASLNENQDSEAVSEEDILSHTQRITELATQIARLEVEKRNVEDDIATLIKRLAVADLEATDAAGRMSQNERELLALQKEMGELNAAERSASADASGKRKALSVREKAAKAKLEQVETQRKMLERMQEKRNRTKIFKTKAERDKWIEEEIQRNHEFVRKATEEKMASTAELARVEKEIAELSTQMSTSDFSTDKIDKSLADHENKIKAKLAQRDELNQERRKLWQSVHEQEAAVQRLGEVSQNARQQWERAVRLDIRQGLQSLKEIVESLNDKKLAAAVHGPLIDLMTVDDGFGTAVEITAGNALFNVVVESFDVSARLLAEMNSRRKAGRVSFFPLDTCNSTPRGIPSTNDCSPLISKVKFDERFKGVMSEVFGRTAVVPSLDVATKLFKELQCDIVTLDGDQLGRKGGITGGFVDRRNMKLQIRDREKDAGKRLLAERARLDGLCQDVAAVEQRITEVLNTLEVLRNHNVSTEKEADVKLREARLLEDRKARLTTQKSNLSASIKSLEGTLATFAKSVEELKAERKDDFKSSWSAGEEAAMEKLAEEVASLHVESATMQAEVLQLATEAQLAEDTMSHVQRRKATVTDRIRELGWSKRTQVGAGGEQAAVKVEHDHLSQRLKKLELIIERDTKEREKTQVQLETLTSSRLLSVQKLQERKDTVDRTQMQRSLLLQRRDDALQRIRKLGVIPKEADQYESFSMGKLMFRLKQVNEALSKLSHVNRKAVDQHADLLERMHGLMQQLQSLQMERESIVELMDHLDKKKDEAIERTYKQIQYQFEEVFHQLVGVEGSSAALQLVTSPNYQAGEDPYAAARIQVSFGLGNPVSRLEQLSGGQKSLVALALIFAIQRCDPAPFYLFDEIDAALDAEYRTSVARMIERQSEECQFIVASFKTEMLDIADKVLGIFFHNKVSRVQAISKEEGVKLLQQAALEDRKRTRDEQ